MRKIRDLFYTGRGTFINRLISGYTGAWFPLWNTLDGASHEEILTRKKETDDWIDGLAWTSTMRDTANGTVVRPAADVLKTPGNWCYVEYEVPETWEEREAMIAAGHKRFSGFVLDRYRKEVEGFPFFNCGTYEHGMEYMQWQVDHNLKYGARDFTKFMPGIRHLPFLADWKRNICSEFGHNAKVCHGLLPPEFAVVNPRESWKRSMLIHHLPTIHYGTGLVVHNGYNFVKDYQDILRAA